MPKRFADGSTVGSNIADRFFQGFNPSMEKGIENAMLRKRQKEELDQKVALAGLEAMPNGYNEDDYSDVISLDNIKYGKRLSKYQKDLRNAELEAVKIKGRTGGFSDLFEQMQKLSGGGGNKEFLENVSVSSKDSAGNTIAFKPFAPTQAQVETRKEYEAAATARGGTREKDAQKKKALAGDIKDFITIDSEIVRGEGFGRFLEGINSLYQGIAQTTDRGQAVALHDGASKRLRVQLVRAAGDVGNINIVEQEAAEKIVPGIFDSKGVAEKKRIYMTQVSKAIDERNPEALKAAFDMAGVGYTERSPQQGQQEGGLPEGFSLPPGAKLLKDNKGNIAVQNADGSIEVIREVQ